ncbi:transcriptional regulator [Escherichia coli]|nr:transcriptional regulator [Escherichia coli]
MRMRTTAHFRYCGIFVSVKPRYAQIMVGRDGEASACWFHSCQSANPVTPCHPFSSGCAGC